MHTTPQTPLGALFDFGGTLCREEDFDLEAGAASIVALAETTNGLTAEALAELLRNMMEDLLPRREASQLELPTTTALRLVYEPNGLTFRNTQEELELTFWRAATTFTPEPGIEDLLAQLTSRGVPIGVVSNTMFSSKAIRWELEQHKLAHFFQFIMTSAEYVVRKPHPMIFRAAAARLGVPPERIWFLGDLPAYDVAGAQSVGMTSIWYNRRSEHSGADTATHTVSSWGELVSNLPAKRE